MPVPFTFQGVGQAKITNRPAKLHDGFSGVVEIKRTEVGNVRNYGPKFFANFDVVESNMPTLNPVGQRASWGQDLVNQDVAPGALKAFIAAVAGVAGDNEPGLAALAPHMDSLLNEAIQQPETNRFVGRRVRVEVQKIKTGQNRDFAVHNWYPV